MPHPLPSTGRLLPLPCSLSLPPKFAAASAAISVSWLRESGQDYKMEGKDTKCRMVCSPWQGRITCASAFRESFFFGITSVTIPFLAGAHATAERQLI